MDCFLSRDTDEKIVTVALKIVFLTCGFFCWLALEHLYRCEEKNLDIGLNIGAKIEKIQILGFFCLKM